MEPLRNGALLPEIRHVFPVGALSRTHYVPEVDLPPLLGPMQFQLTLLSKYSPWYHLLIGDLCTTQLGGNLLASVANFDI